VIAGATQIKSEIERICEGIVRTTPFFEDNNCRLSYFTPLVLRLTTLRIIGNVKDFNKCSCVLMSTQYTCTYIRVGGGVLHLIDNCVLSICLY